jgi:hypothetical protein
MSDEVNKGKVSSDTKWRAAVTGGFNGFQLIPDALVRNQNALGLDATDMVVLLNICMHWWEREPEKLPHPRPVTMARRMGVSTRTIERHIERLCKLGYLEWMPSEPRLGGPSIRPFKLDGLVKKLEQIARNVEVNSMAA